MDHGWQQRFPALFAPHYVEYADADVRLWLGSFNRAVVTRLHLIAVTGDGTVIVCRADDGRRFLPGGTREPGESLDELAARELREEAGAEPTGLLQYFCGLDVLSRRDQPWRPHQSHPRSLWAYAAVAVDVVGPPTCPADVEQIVDVRALEPDEAAAYLDEAPGDGHADVVRLAEAMGLIRAVARR
ncbi:NUDIX domain-containing protein [Luteipulveratus flavus]|uniref:NUDIX domain-containing protein n=1 Tax=Luteipulveratus flavus TaxID=3031728 RepID=A0ABT6C1I8_9MICO|nr:NUDIX domain-containing protein [Luteipulveratus sp. YIM 133296]MDF8262739.1 NUDIX domain-containing protein [Luteipulveratus sp. YIM 133296]